MASFKELAQVKTFKLYKAALKTALARLKPGSPVNFVYLEKFAFDDKERALILVDHQPELVAQLGKKPSATGKCSVNDADKFVFTSSAEVKTDKVVKLFGEVGIPRAVHNPEDRDDTPSQQPSATALKMKHGWTEIRTWGDEARDLIDAFDGLVGVYKGLPPIDPDWNDLAARQDEVKSAMAAMARAEITNDRQAREDQLVKVTALTKVVRKLASDVRDRVIVEREAAQMSQSKGLPPLAKPGAPQASRPVPVTNEPLKPSAEQEASNRRADDLTSLYEKLQKKFGTVFDEAQALGLPTDALTDAERRIEAELSQPAQTVAQRFDTLKAMIVGYDKLGKTMAEANVARQKERDEKARQEQVAREEKARQEELARQQEQAREEELARQQEQARQEELARQQEQARQEELARQQEEARKEELARQQEQARQEELARQPEETADKPKVLTPKEKAALKKGQPAQQPAAPVQKKKNKFVKLDLGAPMTFKEKWANNMVQRVGAVVKKRTEQERSPGGFSTFYQFSQGDSPEPAYEIHIHRNAQGRFVFGQVKYGHLAKVLRGGEEPLLANELATYGIPARETPP